MSGSERAFLQGSSFEYDGLSILPPQPLGMSEKLQRRPEVRGRRPPPNAPPAQARGCNIWVAAFVSIVLSALHLAHDAFSSSSSYHAVRKPDGPGVPATQESNASRLKEGTLVQPTEAWKPKFAALAPTSASKLTQASGKDAPVRPSHSFSATDPVVKAKEEGKTAQDVADNSGAGAFVSPSRDEIHIHSATGEDLYQLWTDAYGVEKHTGRTLKQDKASISGGTAGQPLSWDSVMYYTDKDMHNFGRGGEEASTKYSCPRAPHLQCCDWLTQHRAEVEKRGPNGEAPEWTEPQPSEIPGEEPYPRPPWVRGAPKENLALTHQVQTDIWLNQFPPDLCSSDSTRFLISWWDRPHKHGLGSHIHLMTSMLGLAVKHRRVLVLLNYTFHRAEHPGCKGVGMYGSFGCYFALPSPKECEKKVMDAWRNSTREWRSSFYYCADENAFISNLTFLLSSSQKWLAITPEYGIRMSPDTFPTNWGEPWLQGDGMRNFGTTKETDKRFAYHLKVNWWRSQGVRFLLRWHSAYLCHLLNFARHQTYGLQVAQAWATKNANTNKWCSFPDSACPVPRGTEMSVQEKLLIEAHWPERAELPERKTTVPPTARISYNLTQRLLPQAYLPHPIVQVYYRGSDKVVKEMVRIPFKAYASAARDIMRQIIRTQRDTIWLSSEEQVVFEEARRMKWTVYSLKMEKKFEGGEEPLDQWKFVKRFGIQDYVEASLCNLFVCESSDGFVLPLVSNWGRIVNELKLTSGRLNVPLKALNYLDWP